MKPANDMSVKFRSLIFAMMIGIILSNNIVVPVHLISHIPVTHHAAGNDIHHPIHHQWVFNDEHHHHHHEHDAELGNCDAYHAVHTTALTSAYRNAYFPPSQTLSRPITNISFVIALRSVATPIRAPPLTA